MSDFWVDTGLTRADLEARGVTPGTRVVWHAVTERFGEHVVGKALDKPRAKLHPHVRGMEDAGRTVYDERVSAHARRAGMDRSNRTRPAATRDRAMQLHEVMTQRPGVISASTTVARAVRALAERGTAALPVSADDRVVGIVTHRDLVLGTLAAGRDPATIPVHEVMTPAVVTAYADQDAGETAACMERADIDAVLVVDRAERLVGMVSLPDLQAAVAGEQLAS